MALTDVTTTFTLSDYIGGNYDARRTKAYLTTNAPQNRISDTSTGEVRIGGGRVIVSETGVATATHWAPGVDGNPASWQTTFHIDYVDNATNQRSTTSIGPFTITASGLLTDLIDEQEVPAEYLSTVTAVLDAKVAEAQAARDDAVAISGLTGEDAAVAFLVEDAGSDTAAALSATFVRKERFDIRDFGAVDDETYVTVSTTAASTTIARSSGSFTSADIGKRVSIPGAGNSGGVYAWNTEAPHVATITAVSGATATLSAPAVATAAGKSMQMATDCTPFVQAAMTAAGAVEGEVLVPLGRWHVWKVYPPANTDLVGMGHGSVLVTAPQDFTTGSTNNGGMIAAYASPDSPYGSDASRLEGVRVLNLAIDGQKFKHTGDISNRTKGEGLNFRWGLHCRAENLLIWDTCGDGIDFDESKFCHAVGNRITGAAGWGIHHSNGNVGNVIIGNLAENCGHTMALTSGGGQGGFDSGALSTDLTFIGNVARDCYINFMFTGSGNRVYLSGNRSLGTTVSGDVISAQSAANMPGEDVTFSEDVNIAGTLTQTGAILHASERWVTRASASSISSRYRVTADTQDRHNVRADGAHWWGPGNAAADVSMSRTAADELGLANGDSFKVQGTWDGGQFRFGNFRVWADTSGVLWVKSSAPSSMTDGTAIGGGTTSATSTTLNGITAGVNTAGKYAGKQVWNTTLNRPVWATGSTATSTWVFADGTTAHTPA